MKLVPMNDTYNICCSEEFHGMSYPSFSVVFMQTFSINHAMEFTLPEDMAHPDSKFILEIEKDGETASEIMDKKDVETVLNERLKDWTVKGMYPADADDLEKPILLMQRDVESQIFVLPDNKGVKKWWQRRYRFAADNLYHFTMRGFDFSMNIIPDENDSFAPVVLKGHAHVHADFFFAHTFSLTYRFRFDGGDAGVYDSDGKLCPAVTDQIIGFLSTHLNAEHWSPAKSENSDACANESKINAETKLQIENLWFDADGRYMSSPQPLMLQGEGRCFDAVALRYKEYIDSHCLYKNRLELLSNLKHLIYRRKHPMTVANDTHYAMVDIWEDIQHPTDDPEVPDYFAEETGISEKAVIDHVRDWHKPELIGLMTLYPNEWVYRDAKAYNEVCGEDVAIDTDDLVLAGSNVSLVIGTYGRREDGDEDAKTGWKGHLKGMRKVYQVSWQEYMYILQIVLAKKHVVGLAKEQLVNVSLNSGSGSSIELIKMNADMGMRLTRMVIQLDLLKYSKFASHKVMFDKTTRRLKLERDMQELKDIMEMADSSLHNLSDYKSVKSDYILNVVLAVISVVSAAGLLFQDLRLPFLDSYEESHLSRFNLNDGMIADFLVTTMAVVVVAAIFFVMAWAIIKVFGFIFKR